MDSVWQYRLYVDGTLVYSTRTLYPTYLDALAHARDHIDEICRCVIDSIGGPYTEYYLDEKTGWKTILKKVKSVLSQDPCIVRKSKTFPHKLEGHTCCYRIESKYTKEEQ